MATEPQFPPSPPGIIRTRNDLSWIFPELGYCTMWFSGKLERLSQSSRASTPNSTWRSEKRVSYGEQLSHHSHLVDGPPGYVQREGPKCWLPWPLAHGGF